MDQEYKQEGKRMEARAMRVKIEGPVHMKSVRAGSLNKVITSHLGVKKLSQVRCVAEHCASITAGLTARALGACPRKAFCFS